MSLRFKSSIDTDTPALQILAYWDRLHDFLRKSATAETGVPLQMTWIDITAKTLSTIAYNGLKSMSMSLLLAWVVLLLALGNVRLACLSFGSILATTIWAMGLMHVVGWSFGVMESICVTILVGIVVDYAVHQAHAYNGGSEELLARIRTAARPENGGVAERTSRTVFALEHTGISILGGAATTVASSAALLLCTITFFVKFGNFMLSTSVLSFLFSIVALPAALCEFGPEPLADREREGTTSQQVIPASSADTAMLEEEQASGISEQTSTSGPSSKRGTDDERRLSSRRFCWLLLAIVLVGFGSAFGSCLLNVDRSKAFCPANKYSGGGTETQTQFTFPAFQVPPQQTVYECFGFDFDRTRTQHITRMESIDDAKSIVHHMILYRTFLPFSKCFQSCTEMPQQSSPVFLWAVGIKPFELPEEAGIPVGAFSNNQFTALQIHYNNVDKITPKDSSGVKLTMSSKLRKYDAGFLGVGRNPGSKSGFIMGFGKRYRATITCRPEILLPITIFAHTEHAHLTGRRIRGYLLRNGTETALAESNPYDFQNQHFKQYSLKRYTRILAVDSLSNPCCSPCSASWGAGSLCRAICSKWSATLTLAAETSTPKAAGAR